jgi:hypothetical protein
MSATLAGNDDRERVQSATAGSEDEALPFPQRSASAHLSKIKDARLDSSNPVAETPSHSKRDPKLASSAQTVMLTWSAPYARYSTTGNALHHVHLARVMFGLWVGFHF